MIYKSATGLAYIITGFDIPISVATTVGYDLDYSSLDSTDIPEPSTGVTVGYSPRDFTSALKFFMNSAASLMSMTFQESAIDVLALTFSSVIPVSAPQGGDRASQAESIAATGIIGLLVNRTPLLTIVSTNTPEGR